MAHASLGGAGGRTRGARGRGVTGHDSWVWVEIREHHRRDQSEIWPAMAILRRSRWGGGYLSSFPSLPTQKPNSTQSQHLERKTCQGAGLLTTEPWSGGTPVVISEPGTARVGLSSAGDKAVGKCS